MIYFSLKEPVSYQQICQEIDKLLKKEINSKEKAESSILVIKVSEITNAQEIKKIESA